MRRRLTAGALLPVLAGCATVGAAAGAITQPAGMLRQCGQVQEYTLATRVEGEFTSSDCLITSAGSPVAQPVDFYRFRTDAQVDLTVAFDGPGIHTVRVAIQREDGSVVREVTATSGFVLLGQQLAPGSYRLVLHSAALFEGERLVGPYTLTTTTGRVGFAGCLQLPEIRAGQVLEGAWAVADCKAEKEAAATHVDYHLLEVPAQRDVAVELQAPGLAADLVLYRRDGVELAREVAYRGEAVRLTRQLAPGTYVVVAHVNLTSPRQTGSYTLRVR